MVNINEKKFKIAKSHAWLLAHSLDTENAILPDLKYLLGILDCVELDLSQGYCIIMKEVPDEKG